MSLPEAQGESALHEVVQQEAGLVVSRSALLSQSSQCDGGSSLKSSPNGGPEVLCGVATRSVAKVEGPVRGAR